MSEDLIKYDSTNTLPEELKSKLAEQSKENLEGITPRLPKIQLPTGQSKEFNFEKFGEDAVQQKTFTGVILYQTAANSYWKEKFGSGTSVPPDCASHDGITPSPSYNDIQAKTCVECRWSKFGTATDAAGQKSRGKACRNVKRVVILVQGESIPYLMTIPPGSLKVMDEYLISLRKDGRPYWSVASTFTITTETNTTGIKYPQVHPVVAGYINDPAVINKLASMRNEWMNVIKETKFTGDEMKDEAAPQQEYVPPAGGEEF